MNTSPQRPQPDYYALLEVDRTASYQELVKSHDRLWGMAWHKYPDLHPHHHAGLEAEHQLVA